MRMNKAQPKGPGHPLNQAIYDEFLKKKERMDAQNNSIQLSMTYQKIIKSLEKYPLPILTISQAEKLDGIGVKSLGII